jgi:AAA domain, putative AbiEii toxin, Type IV TA system
MLNALYVSDFGGFKDWPVELRQLSLINYLVGENNSGKSSMIDFIAWRYVEMAVKLTEAQNLILFDSINIQDQNLDFIINSGKSVFLIDEPEAHLHPSLQKRVPYVLDYLSERYGVQFFVATHSPFVISSAGNMTDLQKELSGQNRASFLPAQKVYFLKNFRVAGRTGQIGVEEGGHQKGSFGYWGSKAVYIAGRMLGAGLMDLIEPQQASLTKDAPILVFCEGEGKDEDAKIYNIIFNHRRPSVLFVSSRGSSQLHRTYDLINQIRAGLSANFRMLMLRDRDHEFSSEADIRIYEEANSGSKVLRQRALECYVYSSETAALVLKTGGIKLDPNHRRQMNSLHRRIQSEAEEGIPGNSYKHRLRDEFKQILKASGFWVNNRKGKRNMPEFMASLIVPGTKTYRELEKEIFG